MDCKIKGILSRSHTSPHTGASLPLSQAATLTQAQRCTGTQQVLRYTSLLILHGMSHYSKVPLRESTVGSGAPVTPVRWRGLCPNIQYCALYKRGSPQWRARTRVQEKNERPCAHDYSVVLDSSDSTEVTRYTTMHHRCMRAQMRLAGVINPPPPRITGPNSPFRIAGHG